MLTKEKALYQVKLILDYLPKEEYELIPQDTINYIEENFEYDESIEIDPSIPLENQKIDDKAYDLLQKIIKKVKNNQKEFGIDEVVQSVKRLDEVNQNNDEKIENAELKNKAESLEQENSKFVKAKELLEEYKEILKQKDEQIEKLKEDNEYLYKYIYKIPKILRRFFIKEDMKLLNK